MKFGELKNDAKRQHFIEHKHGVFRDFAPVSEAMQRAAHEVKRIGANSA